MSGLRYDYDPAVKLLVSNGETVNALNLPGRPVHHRIDKQTAAYTTGCASPADAALRSRRSVER